LRKAALRGEGYDRQREIAKEQESEKNKALGQLQECRAQEQRKQRQILDLTGKLARERQKRKTIAWIGGSSTAAAFVAGSLITFFVLR